MTSKHNSISPKAIAAYCRSRARTWEMAAKTIEDAFAGEPEDPENGQQPIGGAIDSQSVRELVSKKAMRVKDIATRFSVGVETVEKIINEPESGLIRAGKGWIKPK